MSNRDEVPSLTDELASMTRMFHAACADLGLINEALGLDPNDGGAAPILEAIAELKSARDQWVDANFAPTAEQADAVRAPKARGDHAIWLLEALIDIYDDWQNNAPEDRCYAEDAWSATLADIRAFLAAPASSTGDQA